MIAVVLVLAVRARRMTEAAVAAAAMSGRHNGHKAGCGKCTWHFIVVR